VIGGDQGLEKHRKWSRWGLAAVLLVVALSATVLLALGGDSTEDAEVASEPPVTSAPPTAQDEPAKNEIGDADLEETDTSADEQVLGELSPQCFEEIGGRLVEIPCNDCFTFVDGEWVEGSCAQASSSSTASSSGSAGSANAARPSQSAPSSEGQFGSNQPVETIEEPGLLLGPPGSGDARPTADCPDTREENPTIYDACRAGFEAPRLEWAGYHKCVRVSQERVDIYGLVRAVGGNYAFVSRGGNVVDGMLSVYSGNTSAPYGVFWYATFTFWSMDPRYHGIIDRVTGWGTELISEEQLDPACRL
jgi:hypothetical protein